MRGPRKFAKNIPSAELHLVLKVAIRSSGWQRSSSKEAALSSDVSSLLLGYFTGACHQSIMRCFNVQFQCPGRANGLRQLL